MAHAHSHENQNSYYLDQLFSIAGSGALAGVTIALWQTGILDNMLHPKFRIWVLLGGVGLLLVVLLRAVAVWRSVDAPAAESAGDHDHEHGPDCGHAHGHETAITTPPGLTTALPPPALANLPLAPAAPVPTETAGHSHAHGHSHAQGHTHSHGADPAHDHGWAPWRYVVLLLPVVLYFLILSNTSINLDMVDTPFTGLEYISNFINQFRSILWEALPFIVLGAVIAGILEEVVPQRAIAAVLPRNWALAVALGGVLGLVFPMCECGIVPIMRRLLRKGLPLSCCVAYLLAGPIINFVVLSSTYFAFWGMENVYEGGKPSYQMGGWWMLGFRAGLGYLVAIVTAGIIEWLHRKHGDALLTPLARPGRLPLADDDAPVKSRTLEERVNNISETSLHDFVDITVFLILGALLAATTRIFLTADTVAQLSQQHVLLSIVLMMGLAIVLCLCSEADAFVAASFVTLRPSAKLAFLVLGPMIDFKLYLMYTQVFRPRLIWTIYGAVIVQVLVYSYATHVVWERFAPSWITPVQVSQAAREAKPSIVNGIAKVSFRQLEDAAQSPSTREYYEKEVKWVQLVGRYASLAGQPGQLLTLHDEEGKTHQYEQRFRLIRFKINCCAADATPLKAMILLDKESKLALPADAALRNHWVEVTGRIRFLPAPGGDHLVTLLLESKDAPLPPSELVREVPPDPNPYEY